MEELAGKRNLDIEGFNTRLLAALPGIRGHYGTRGKLGDFMEQIEEGIHFARIVERVTLELSDLAGIPVYFGRTRRAGEAGWYDLVVAYTAEHAMRYLLETAVEMVDALPGVTRVEHRNESECCGFGGTFSLKHADISGAMVQDKLASACATGSKKLVSADCGCLLNIGHAAKHQQAPLEVEHMASFLWRRTGGGKQGGAQ